MPSGNKSGRQFGADISHLDRFSITGTFRKGGHFIGASRLVTKRFRAIISISNASNICLTPF